MKYKIGTRLKCAEAITKNIWKGVIIKGDEGGIGYIVKWEREGREKEVAYLNSSLKELINAGDIWCDEKYSALPDELFLI